MYYCCIIVILNLYYIYFWEFEKLVQKFMLSSSSDIDNAGERRTNIDYMYLAITCLGLP